MTDDEVAACHEAAHAVVAASGEWIELAEATVLRERGYGVAAISMKREAIQTALQDGQFDCDLPRQELVRAFLAGAVMEMVLTDRGQADLNSIEILSAARGDYALARDQLAKLDSPPPGGIADFEEQVRELIERPIVFCVIKAVADELMARRMLSPAEIYAMLEPIADRCERDHAADQPLDQPSHPPRLNPRPFD